MKFFSIVATAAVLGLASFAQAADVDIQLNSNAWDVNQVGIAGAGAIGSNVVAKAEVTNLAAVSSVEAVNVDDLTVNANAGDVNQLGLSAAVAWDANGNANAGVTQAAGLVSLEGTNLTGNSDVFVSASAFDVNQVGGSLALGGNRAVADVTNLAGLASLDLDGVPSGADIGNIGVSAVDVNQVGISLAGSLDTAIASVTNAAGVGSVSVNVAD